MPGMVEMAEEIFAMPVRIGVPRDVPPEDGLQFGPKFATAVGLVRYAHERIGNGEAAENGNGQWMRQTTGKVKDWFQGMF